MILLDVKLDHILGFRDFHINFSYPKKIVNSIIEDEFLPGHERFRYKKAVILMGTNATGKTTFGKALSSICAFINTGNPAFISSLPADGETGKFTVDLVNGNDILHRISGHIPPDTIPKISCASCPIGRMDSYEKCAARLEERLSAVTDFSMLRRMVGELSCRFSYPEIESSLKTGQTDAAILQRTLQAVISTLDPTFTEVVRSKDLKDSFIIRRRGAEIIIQEGQLLNGKLLSSGTAEGIDVAIFLAHILSGQQGFYYCDEHFSYIQSDIEKRIFGIMLEHIGQNSQLIFTTHNTDMLDLNLPKHSFMFLRREKEEDGYRISAVSASDLLKRNTDSVRSAVENDVFSSLPDDSPLDALDTRWPDEQ